MQEVFDNFHQATEDKKLYLKYNKPANLPPVYADDEKIRQVVINFIDNAIKYTGAGGVTVDVYKKGGNIICCVRDTGMGVAKADQSRLFKKFSRGEDAFLINTEGSGLGLYVAQMMVTAQKGKIWVESDGEGKGSSFCFSLPVYHGRSEAKTKKIKTENIKKE